MNRNIIAAAQTMNITIAEFLNNTANTNDINTAPQTMNITKRQETTTKAEGL